MKSFVPPIIDYFSWAWAKNMCGNESHDKETTNIHASAADLLHIRKGNLYWCKCKNEAKEIDCLCCREMDAMLIIH